MFLGYWCNCLIDRGHWESFPSISSISVHKLIWNVHIIGCIEVWSLDIIWQLLQINSNSTYNEYALSLFPVILTYFHEPSINSIKVKIFGLFKLYFVLIQLLYKQKTLHNLQFKFNIFKCLNGHGNCVHFQTVLRGFL